MNVAKIISQTVKALPKTKGFNMPKMVFEGEALKTATGLLRIPENVTAELTRGLSSPKVEIALKNSAKAKTNYAIAGIRIKDGENVVAQGALSLTNPGARDSVVKLRITDGNGQHIKGFFDSGKMIDTRDISASLSRKKGVFTTQAEVGEAYAHNIRVNESTLLDTMGRIPNGNELIAKYNQFNTDLRLGALDIANSARKVLRGEYQEPVFAKILSKAETHKVEEVAKKVCEKPFKKYDFSKVLKDADYVKFKKISLEDILKKYPDLKLAETKINGLKNC